MKLDCDIIRDLLPTYADGLTSEKSNAVINEHIAGCRECRKFLTDIKHDIEPPIRQGEEIAYLKKFKSRSRRQIGTTAIVFAVLAVILCAEIVIHMLPLQGATKSDLKDYNTYPLMTVNLSDLENSADINDDSVTYRIKWTDGNALQNAVLKVVHYRGNPKTEQISVSCNSLFFKQAGSAVNCADGIIYVQITGYRKTLFYTGKAESFGFAVKIIDDLKQS